MKTKTLICIVCLLIFAVSGFAQSVKITPNKVTYKRIGADVPDHKKTFTITYPKIVGKDGKQIERLLDYEKNFEFSLKEEINEMHWLSSADYEVFYNQSFVLSMVLSIEGVGAYPSGTTKYFPINLKNNSIITAKDVFINLKGLAAKCQQKQNAEIKAEKIRLKKDEPAEEVDEAFNRIKFKVEDLNIFSVTAKGVKFHFDYGFPHAVLAWQPSGEYFFSWKELKPFIKKDGLFAQFVK